MFKPVSALGIDVVMSLFLEVMWELGLFTALVGILD